MKTQFQEYRVIIKVKLTLRYLTLSLILFSLVLSACQPKPLLTTPETGPVQTQAATKTLEGLLVNDTGMALPVEIMETVPALNQPLPVQGKLKLVFNQEMDIEKTSSAWKLTDENGQKVDGNINWSSPRTLEFTPDQTLAAGSRYIAMIQKNAVSAEGSTLQEDLTIAFNTVSPLQISQVFPDDKSDNVANDAVITVIFNRPVVPLVILEEKDKLPNPLVIEPELPGTGEWVNSSIYAFRPSKPYKADTTYKITVQAGLTDSAGETALSKDYEWTFTTEMAGIQSYFLSDGRENLPNFQKNILLNETFTVIFKQPMQRASTERAISLTSKNGEKVPWKSSWNEEFTQVKITPIQLLSLETQYIFKVDKAALAADGAQLRHGLEWNFYTIPSPKVIGFSPSDGNMPTNFSSEMRIRFASPMNIETVKENIIIKPEPAEPVDWWYNDWDWSMASYSLEPSTTYEVTLLAGMEDIFGNPFPESKTYRFTTKAYEPIAYLRMPYQTPILRQGGPQEFYIESRNTRIIDLKLYKLDLKRFVAFESGDESVNDFNPDDQDLVWEQTVTSQAKLDERVLKSFSPRTPDNQDLENGFYLLLLDSPETANYNRYDDYRLMVVASASLNFKASSSDGLVWLTDLKSGQPVPNVPVTVYNRNNQAIGEGITDPDGLVYLNLPKYENDYEHYFATAQTDQVFAYVSSEWNSDLNLWDYGLWGGYFPPPGISRAYVFTERPIYRPGQPVYFKGIVRIDDDLRYRLPEIKKVHVKIESYKDIVHEADYDLNDMGSFDGKFTLENEASLGYYTITVTLPESTTFIGMVGFNVSEYRRPEFQVKVNGEPQNTLNGETFTASVQADYYSGGGLGNAQVDWTLIQKAFYFTPPESYSMFNFNDFEEFQEFFDNQYSGSSLVAEGQGTTNEEGFYETTLPVDLGTAGVSQELTFEASITDLAQNFVSGRTTIIAHKAQVYPGIRSIGYIGEAGEPQTFELVVLDWDGNPLPGQKVSVEFVERRWYSVQEQDAEGRVTWKSTVEEIPVDSQEDLITDDDGLAKAVFTPPTGGVYRARVKSQDSQGNLAQASTYVWVSSNNFIPWRQTNDRSFDLITNQTSYKPGEKAEILIASPFQGEAFALVSVERGRIHYQDVITLTSNSTIYQLPITPQMAPNVFISVLIVKGIDESNPRPNFRMGIKEIQVDSEQVALKVELSADPPKAGPGDTVRYSVRTLDYKNQPVSAEVSLSLSDLATLSLMEPNSPLMKDFFYSKRDLGIWTVVPISKSIEDYNQNVEEELVQGNGMGGGGGEKGFGELGVIEIREDFPDTAFWEAFVLTDENGEANVSVTLPDNLTIWRMDARAVTKDTLVGQSTLDLTSTKPLLVRPQTPRFLVAGDHVYFGAAIHNNTDQALQVKASLDALGVDLISPAIQEVEMKPNSQVYVSWYASVQPTAQRADLVFQAKSGDLVDITRPTMGTLDNQGIPVYSFTVPETVGASGMLTSSGSVLEAISLPESWQSTQGSLDISLSPSLAAGVTDSLDYLENFPYNCLEQTISRFLPNVLSTQALKAAGLSDPKLEANLEEQVSLAMQQISSLQNPNGGWGWWGADKSDPLTSAYVVLGLVEAKDAGYVVTKEVLARGVRYLQSQVYSSVRLTSQENVNRQAFFLYVLNRAGKPQVSSSVQLFEYRENGALYARAWMAQTLYAIDPEDTRVDTLLSDLNSAAILSATGAHWEEGQIDRRNWNTDTRTTAVVLSALNQIDPENPLNANAVRWLIAHQKNGHWNGTQETAWTLMALINWMKESGELEADYKYGLALNGEQLGGGVANSTNLRESQELTIEISKLIADEANRLLIARDEGPGNLYYTAHLNVYLPVDQVKAVDQGLSISRSYYQLDDLETPVTQTTQGELLLARLTLVAPNALHYVVVDDPLPAGLEAVDQSLMTSPQNLTIPQEYTWEELFWKGWGWWNFSHIQYKDEKLVLSTDYLPAGTHIYTYLVRAGSVGEFYVIPPTAQEFYFPEVYGRGEGGLFIITPPQ